MKYLIFLLIVILCSNCQKNKLIVESTSHSLNSFFHYHIDLLAFKDSSNFNSFISLDTLGKTFGIESAKKNSNFIDLVFIHSDMKVLGITIFGNTLASPSHPLTASRLNNLYTWKKINKTKLYQVNLNYSDFVKLNVFNSNSIPSILNTQENQEVVINLYAGKVVGFETESGKKGLILVKSISYINTPKIDLEIKLIN